MLLKLFVLRIQHTLSLDTACTCHRHFGCSTIYILHIIFNHIYVQSFQAESSAWLVVIQTLHSSIHIAAIMHRKECCSTRPLGSSEIEFLIKVSANRSLSPLLHHFKAIHQASCGQPALTEGERGGVGEWVYKVVLSLLSSN